MKQYQTDCCIVGAGLAGLCCAYELLNKQKRVILLDRDTQENIGGLAKESFGGVTFIDSKLQKKAGIKDSPELAFRDWLSYARFDKPDTWGERWAKLYCEKSIPYIYEWLNHKKVSFLPIVNWPERGLFVPGNSVPRWHIAWGTGQGIIEQVLTALKSHPNFKNLQILTQHRVDDFVLNHDDRSCSGEDELKKEGFSVKADHVIIACGGFSGGDLSVVKRNWYKPWGKAPENLLNGAHKYGDGKIHFKLQEKGAVLDNMDKQWHYAAGIHHPKPRKINHGLSLVPPKSALWLDSSGKRFSPQPLVAYTDTRFFVETITQTEDQYSWLLLNMKIAKKELAVSGSEYMTSFRDKNKLKIARELFLGNTTLVNRLLNNHIDVLSANNLPDLVKKMNDLTGNDKVSLQNINNEVAYYDNMIDRGEQYFNDDQLRRIAISRKYKGDRVRTCKFQKIGEAKALPYIAIRCMLISRKSLGGIVTNLQSQVLNSNNEVIEGLYAIGEAAGFGGGGIHGYGSLEGTFLGSCLLTAQRASENIK